MPGRPTEADAVHDAGLHRQSHNIWPEYSGHHGKGRNGHISTMEASEIMAAIDAPEPANWRGAIRKHFSEPSLLKAEKGSESWPVNHGVQDRNTVT